MMGVTAAVETGNGAGGRKRLQQGRREANAGQSKPGSRRLVMGRQWGCLGLLGARLSSLCRQTKQCSSGVVGGVAVGILHP